MITEAKVELYYLHKSRRIHSESSMEQREALLRKIETLIMEVDHIRLLIEQWIDPKKKTVANPKEISGIATA